MDTRMLIVIGALLVCGCVQQAPADFSLEYSTTSGYPVYGEVDFKWTLTVSPDGSWEHKAFDERGTTVEGSGKLTAAEMAGLYSTVLESKFFSLPEDISMNQCADGSTEYLAITASGNTRKVGGYCVENEPFRKITDKLSSLTIEKGAEKPPTEGIATEQAPV
jgi:hypothetical protein